jgi:hypothetical protein
MTLTGSGLVGIGTTDARGVLRLAGSSANAFPNNGSLLWLTDTNAATDYKNWSVSSINGDFGLARASDAFNTGQNAYKITGAVTQGYVGEHIWYTNDSSEKVRIDNSGRLLVGTSSNRTSFASQLQLEGTGSAASSGSFTRNTNDSGGPSLILAKSRGSSNGSYTVVQSDDVLGTIQFVGADGSTDVAAAYIYAQADGTPGANDMPGRLVFSTTSDNASSPTERARITSGGNLLVGTTSNINFEKLGVIQAGNGNAAALACTDASLTQTVLQLYATRDTTNNTYYFLQCINSTTATNKLLIADSGNVTNANNSYTGISDIKLKENIADANSQWSDIRSLQVRNYNFKEETGQATHRQIGLIAQEVEQICPNLVDESFDRDAEGNDLGTVTKSVNYSVLYMKAVKALQEAMERIEVLEQRLADAGIA